VRVLLESGASAADITLSPGDPKAPSAEVASLLLARGAKQSDQQPGPDEERGSAEDRGQP
jgi:hypothetical protein